MAQGIRRRIKSDESTREEMLLQLTVAVYRVRQGSWKLRQLVEFIKAMPEGDRPAVYVDIADTLASCDAYLRQNA